LMRTDSSIPPYGKLDYFGVLPHTLMHVSPVWSQCELFFDHLSCSDLFRTSVGWEVKNRFVFIEEKHGIQA